MGTEVLTTNTFGNGLSQIIVVSGGARISGNQSGRNPFFLEHEVEIPPKVLYRLIITYPEVGWLAW